MRSTQIVMVAIALVAVVASMVPAQAASLSVTVTDQSTGAQLAKAVVAVVVGNAVVAAGRTAPNGSWTCQVADAAKAYIVVGKKLYAPMARQVALSGEMAQSFGLEKFGTEDFTHLGRIVGFVRNGEGKPVANATLVLLKGSTPVGVTQSQTPTGIYELEWYAPRTYTVRVTAPGHSTATYADQRITAGESLWLAVTLQPR